MLAYGTLVSGVAGRDRGPKKKVKKKVKNKNKREQNNTTGAIDCSCTIIAIRKNMKMTLLMVAALTIRKND